MRFPLTLPCLIGAALLAYGEDGLAAKYPGDAGIETGHDVLFAENFETANFSKWDEIKGPVTVVEEEPNSGRYCVRMFLPGADTVSDILTSPAIFGNLWNSD